MSLIERRLETAFRTIAPALGTLSLALTRRKVNRKLLLSTSEALRSGADELDRIAEGL